MCADDYWNIFHVIIAISMKLRQLSIEFLSGYHHTMSTSSIILLKFFPERFGTELVNAVSIDLVSLFEYQLQQFSISAEICGYLDKKKREESIQLAESSILLEKIKLESVLILINLINFNLKFNSVKGGPIIHSLDQKLHIFKHKLYPS